MLDYTLVPGIKRSSGWFKNENIMYTVKEVMKMYSILVCDDDKEIVEAIARHIWNIL